MVRKKILRGSALIKKLIKAVILICVTSLCLSCSSQWSVSIQADQEEFTLNKRLLDEYQYLKNNASECEGLPLEIALYQNDINVIDSIVINSAVEIQHTYLWEDIAETACITKKGVIIIEEEELHPKKIIVNVDQSNYLKYSLLNIYPTIAAALEIKIDEELFKNPLINYKTDHVVLFFLDGLSGHQFQSAVEEGLITALQNTEFYTPALTVYPPRTTIASAAIITGRGPSENGVNKSGIRQTTLETICDVVADRGFTAIAVEGESLSFNLGDCEIVLSGDRNSDGSTDDNVFKNVVSVIENDMPDFFYIHFHGIDDVGHTYGPDSQVVLEKIKEINRYLEQIIERLPESTMVITFADHGMHSIDGKQDKGNHGNLIAQDMVVFIHILIK
jgi:hypothetical protein